MKKLISLALILFFGAFSATVHCQAVCPIITLKVNKVSGKIIEKGKLATPFPDVKVELRKINDEETLVSSTTSDKLGFFEFEEIEKGKYLFLLDFNKPSFVNYRAVVKVKKTNSSKSKPSILIVYSGDCWDTEALTVK